MLLTFPRALRALQLPARLPGLEEEGAQGQPPK